MARRILIFGNSGSGKSTLARRLAADHALVHLDLDTIVWEPGRVAVQRAPDAVQALLADFIDHTPDWVIEGCYGELVERALAHCTELVWLEPGRDACLRHNAARPWEPHKYASPAEQDAMLANLQAWTAGYYERNDAWSHSAHRRLFDGFDGRKQVLRSSEDTWRYAPSDRAVAAPDAR